MWSGIETLSAIKVKDAEFTNGKREKKVVVTASYMWEAPVGLSGAHCETGFWNTAEMDHIKPIAL